MSSDLPTMHEEDGVLYSQEPHPALKPANYTVRYIATGREFEYTVHLFRPDDLPILLQCWNRKGRGAWVYW